MKLTHGKLFFKVCTPVGCILSIFVSNHTFPHINSVLTLQQTELQQSSDGLPLSWDDEPAIFYILLEEPEHQILACGSCTAFCFVVPFQIHASRLILQIHVSGSDMRGNSEYPPFSLAGACIY